MGLKIMSFPEYLYEQTREKKRIVVAGSHGKTTTTAMIMHVLNHASIDFDYMVGSSIEGFETMVGLSENAGIAVLEGDEYLTSPIDRRPKFHLYKPDIAILNGIAWDHMNVFPEFDNYLEQFRIFAGTITEGGTLIYFKDDPLVNEIAEKTRADIIKIPYTIHGYFSNITGFYGATHDRVVPLRIFGEHNMQNLSAAREACLLAGVTADQFYEAITSFEGTSKRLQKIAESDKGIVYLDFAHAPSKVKATVNAIAENYSHNEIVACLELHTFSSLNINFLPQYKDTLAKASYAFIYFNPHAVEMKKLAALSKELIAEAFGSGNIKVYDDSHKLFNDIKKLKLTSPVYLLMSSGDFDGNDLNEIAGELV
jgi:UDP-N-acetylmuramate: L-alanyl-gamma-D-glutamyl-meso-diaminopimelate ligase